MNNKYHYLIKCPTYKEAFILRRALIELGYTDKHILNLCTWQNLWDNYNENTVYRVDNDDIGYSYNQYYSNNLYYIKYYKYIDINNFIKKYIRYYE